MVVIARAGEKTSITKQVGAESTDKRGTTEGGDVSEQSGYVQNQELRPVFQTNPEYVRKQKGSENVIAPLRIHLGPARLEPTRVASCLVTLRVESVL